MSRQHALGLLVRIHPHPLPRNRTFLRGGQRRARLLAQRIRLRPRFPAVDRVNERVDFLSVHGFENVANRAEILAPWRCFRVNGPLACLLWLGVHIWYLIGFQNRLLVITQWAFSFVTRRRGAQLITGSEADLHKPNASAAA